MSTQFDLSRECGPKRIVGAIEEPVLANVIYGDYESTVGSIAGRDAEMAKMHDQLDSMAFSDGRLPKKIKLLMAMAIDASHGKEGSVKVYASRAKEAGRPRFSRRSESRPLSTELEARAPL